MCPNEALAKTLKQYGGPVQYLEAVLPDTEKKNEFSQWLVNEFPPQEDVTYETSSVIPPVEKEAMSSTPARCVHVSALGFSSACSVKVLPGTSQRIDISEEILADGFLTSGDVLRVLHPEEGARSIRYPKVIKYSSN